jgi:hypothetical protein
MPQNAPDTLMHDEKAYACTDQVGKASHKGLPVLHWCCRTRGHTAP